MTNNIIWSPAATKDLNTILTYLQDNWEERIINVFLNKLDESILLIAKTPKIFPIINSDLQIRKCVVTKQNTLYYREIKYNIEIVRLFDSRQNPKKLTF